MNRRLMVPLLALLLMVPFMPQPLVSAREPSTINTMIEDGDIDVSYDRVNNAAYLYVTGSASFKRVYFEFDVSAIPDTAVIESVTLWVKAYSAANPDVGNIYSLAHQPSATSSTTIYEEVGDYKLYASPNIQPSDAWIEIPLGSDAIDNLTTQLALDWFAMGIKGGNTPSMYSSESAGNEPYLEVQWHLATDYAFTVENPVYENNTDAGTVSVHVTGDGFDEDHDISAETTLYFPVMPEAFSWDIGGGASRMVFTPDEENFTVTLPEATDYIYSFTVIDYTGRLGNGTAYLEAWRSIGGVETLVERMPIVQPNAVPLNLVYGRTYHMQVLFADGTRYDWGYYVAAGSFTATIVIRGVEFTDQAQTLYNDIHVEAQRVNATYITIDYLDDRNATVWANVTIRIRGGAVVLSSPQNVSSYTVNWGSADPDTGYVVTVTGEHTDYGEWGYSKILDQPEDFPAAPDLTGIFNLGLGPNLLGWIVTAATVVGFSVRFQARGLLAGAAVASMLTYIGWATFDWDLLVGLWVIAVVVALGGGER